MMHNRAGRKLRRTTSHRLAMFSNQLASLMTHERIQTTLSKAKELRPLAEKLVTAAKNDSVAARRHVARWIPDRTTVKRVFETVAPRFVDRPGGYTRILRLRARRTGEGTSAIATSPKKSATRRLFPLAPRRGERARERGRPRRPRASRWCAIAAGCRGKEGHHCDRGTVEERLNDQVDDASS